MMNVNPAMIKQLLSLQLTQRMDTFQTGSSVAGMNDAGKPDTDFAQLLGLLLSASEGYEAPSGRVIPAAELLAKGKLTWSSYANSPGESLTEAPRPSAYEGLIGQAASRHDVDPSLIRAVIRAESSYDTHAVSSAGAKGLMQLMDSTGRGLGVTDPFDPKQNIEGGTKFLSGLLKKYNGNEAVALAAYNAGPSRVDRLGIRSDQDLQAKAYLLPKETRNYVNKVLDYKQSYEI